MNSSKTYIPSKARGPVTADQCCCLDIRSLLEQLMEIPVRRGGRQRIYSLCFHESELVFET